MRPISVANPESSRALLQQEINRHQDARYDHRLHCVSLVASGIPCEQVALYFGDSPRSVVNWVRRFDRQGLAGLAEGNHSGRPGRLSAEQLEAVRAMIRRPPTAANLKANLWDGKTLARCLQEQYQVQLGVRQCQRLFRHLNMRYRLPRPSVGKADPRRQAEHKKNSNAGRTTRR
ncbi:MAG: helix-turn-helix domain-containing protein [Verrucomicrobiota bacterium]